MYSKKLVTKDTYYVGASDRRLSLFENIYPLENGVSYNSYLILDEKTCLFDSVDSTVSSIYLKKVEEVLNGLPLDYFVIHHMEPDHSAGIYDILAKHPDVTLVINEKILTMLKNFNNNLLPKNYLIVNENDTLVLGKHTLVFVMAPMVHWPEVMVSYDLYTNTLFSADAFGTFGALSGNLFAHEVNFEHNYLDEARRYYTNIVGKYGNQVQAILKKAATLPIETIAPLHGPIWRQDISYLVNLYDKWSAYEPEERGVLIVYGSIYGYTEVVANLVADELGLAGIRNIHMYDASKTDKSYLLAEAFKYSHIVILSSTYNMGIFTPVEEFLLDLKAHNLQNRKVVLVENGSWAPNSGKLMKEILSSMKNMEIINEVLTIKSAINDQNISYIKSLTELIANDFPKVKLDGNPLFKIGYGLYVLTTNDGKKDNGCIINVFTQLGSNPDSFLIAVNKANYSTKIIQETGVCNVSVLTKNTPFNIFEKFGFASGRDTDKFKDFGYCIKSSNELQYLFKYTNAYFSLKVKETIDLGSHFGFICEAIESKILSNERSVTYDDYFDYIKPKPARNAKKVKGWICKICGFIYEGEDIPADYICPICKHGVVDFERIK